MYGRIDGVIGRRWTATPTLLFIAAATIIIIIIVVAVVGAQRVSPLCGWSGCVGVRHRVSDLRFDGSE